jgi:parallel beta-helix repeat protein
MKILGAQNLTICGNNVHDNNGNAIWSDTNYPTVLIDNNTVSGTSKAGIWHEVSYNAIIRNNIVTGNGSPSVVSSGCWIGRTPGGALRLRISSGSLWLTPRSEGAARLGLRCG